MMDKLARQVAARFIAADEDRDPVAFNTALSKLLSKLKRDAGASQVRQNYKGTGSQSFRRQVLVRFQSGALTDIWLNKDYVEFNGVVGMTGSNKPVPKPLAYDDMTPEQVYAKIADALKEWAKP
jgi:hypothetical protein